MKRVLVVIAVLALPGCHDPDATTAPAPPAPPSANEAALLQRTAAAHAEDAPVPSGAATTAPAREAIGEHVAYGELGEDNLRGYLAMPADVTGPLPGIIVIHEWWGLNDNIRKMTKRLAAEGYVALAVDLYGGKVADTPADARQLMSSVMQAPQLANDNLRQAYDYLDHAVGAPSIGAIGWCMGGGWSLRTALLFPKRLDAAVIYYGDIAVDEQQLAALEVPVLGLFGSRDPVIPLKQVESFRARMDRLGKRADIHVYDGAGHAFANPSGTSYEPVAAKDAWHRTVAFLKENLSAD